MNLNFSTLSQVHSKFVIEHRGAYVAGVRITDPASTATVDRGSTLRPGSEPTEPGGDGRRPQSTLVSGPIDAVAQRQGHGARKALSLLSSKFKSRKSEAKKQKITPKEVVPEELSAEVNTAIETREQEAGQSQKTVNFWKRMEWVHRDQESLRSTIEDLRRGNNNLESYLMLCSIGNPAGALPSSDKVAAFWPVARRIDGALRTLHKGLTKINPRSGARESYFLSLQLREDHHDTWRELNAQDGVSLQDDSYVFNIQRHSQKSLADDAVLFSIEAYTSAKDIQQTLAEEPLSSAQALSDLHDREVIQDDEARDSVVLWGYQVLEPKVSPNIFVFYRDNEGSWSTPTTLEDVLAQGEYRDRISPAQTVQLARVVTSTYLHLAGVRDSCEVPRLANYRYYKTSDEQDTWDSGSPRVLRPWLACGFGRKPKAPKLGAGTGEARPPNALIVELGLVLYQIGTGDPIDYGSGRQGLTDAKNRALKGLDKLDRRIGSVFGEIVAGFLNFSSTAAYLEQGHERLDETEYIQNAISALVAYEQMVESTATAPFQFPKVTVTDGKQDVAQVETGSVSGIPGVVASLEIITDTVSAATTSQQTTLSEHDRPLDPATILSGDVIGSTDANNQRLSHKFTRLEPYTNLCKATEATSVIS